MKLVLIFSNTHKETPVSSTWLLYFWNEINFWHYLTTFQLNYLLSNIQYPAWVLMHETAPFFLEQVDSKSLYNFLNFSAYPAHAYYQRYHNGQYIFLIQFTFQFGNFLSGDIRQNSRPMVFENIHSHTSVSETVDCL